MSIRGRSRWVLPRAWAGWLLAGAVALAAGLGAARPDGPGSQPPVIQEIAWRDFGLVLKATAPLDPEIFTLEGPYRFVVDLPEAEFADTALARPIPVGLNGIQRVRCDQKPGKVRLVVDCTGPTGLQVMTLGDRSTLLLVRAGVRHPDLAALVGNGTADAPGAQPLRTVWARESGDALTLHVRGAKALKYALVKEDAAHVQLRVPGGRYPSLLPTTGKLLEKVGVKTGPDGTWTLDVGLSEGYYQLAEGTSADGRDLTLTWKKLNPRRYPDRPLVVIDPGHGGSDPGALGPTGVPEKVVCLEMAKQLQAALWRRRINAVLTRSTDAEILLAPRLAMIDQVKADLFVSLHANSHTGPDSMGTETFWRESPSQPFAQTVHKELTALLKRPDRGVKQERLYVIRHARVPSILVESGFISNPAEERMLADRGFQGQAASAIVTGIEKFLQNPPQARVSPPSPGGARLGVAGQRKDS